MANGSGDPGTSPEINNDKIWFNGVGDDSHETFAIYRIRQPRESWQGKDRRGWDFTKTARKPYDPVVVACLCYLSTITRKDDPTTHEPIMGTEVYTVSSDGDGNDFVSGLDLARKALPAKANLLDLPMSIMQADRWCGPWVDAPKNFEVRFCLDGKGYVLHHGDSYCFESHVALANFLESTKFAEFKKGGTIERWGTYGRTEPNIWHATGSFDQKRHDRIALAQARVLRQLFPVDPACAQDPPAYVRPGAMPANAGRNFCYSVADLLALG